MKSKFFFGWFYFVLFFGITALSVSAALAAAEGLSDAEKTQKREELESFFSSALLRSQITPSNEVNQIFRLTANASTRYGYESNVDLDSSEQGDEFYQEKVGGRLEFAPPIASWGQSSLSTGAEGRYEYWGYFDREDLNRQNAVVSPFLKLSLNKSLSVETSYVFRWRRYDSQEDLNYISNGAKVLAEHQVTPGLIQHGTFTYEHRGYSERASLTSGGLLRGDERTDNHYETAYGIRYRAGAWTLSVEGDGIWNDSSDIYFDYNDYQEGGVNGSASYRVMERIILTAFGGWEHRSYGARPANSNPANTQEDDWYYAGGRIFYALNTWSGLDVTFTDYNNHSNDSSHDYHDTLTSIGYHVYF